MRGLLLNQLNYITHSIRSVIAYQKMDMVFVGFHRYNAVPFRITDIVYLLLYIVSDSTFEYLFAVLGNKNDMYFQAIFTPVAMVISAVHRLFYTSIFKPMNIFNDFFYKPLIVKVIFSGSIFLNPLQNTLPLILLILLRF